MLFLGFGFQNCVDKWCSQDGTNGQYTKCDNTTEDGQTCYNPEIKYGTTVGGRPVVRTESCPGGIMETYQETLDWCKQIFPMTEKVSWTTGGTIIGEAYALVLHRFAVPVDMDNKF